MDGFDDLLDNSRPNPILENPFEDPFARPRSPDPWLTFSPQEQTARVEQPHEPQSPVLSQSVSPSGEANLEPVDPLDAKAANVEDEVEDFRPLRPHLPNVASPSQSPPTTSHITTTHVNISAAPVVPEADSHPKSLVLDRKASPPPPTSEPSQTHAPPDHRPPSPRPAPTSPVTLPASSDANSSAPVSAPSLEHSSQLNPPPARPAVISPLDGPRNGQPSFATLALGGEMPGWQGSISNQARVSNYDEASSPGGWGEHGNGEDFVNGVQRRNDDDDDDDDDLPIAV